MDSRRLWLPGLPTRVLEFMASGVDPSQYLVSVGRLRQVIADAPGNDRIKATLLAFLEENLSLSLKTDIQAIELGYWMSEFAENSDDTDLIAINADIRDLDKLPFSFVNGTRVS